MLNTPIHKYMDRPVCGNLFRNIELAGILKTYGSSVNICVVGVYVVILVVHISPKLPSVENIDLNRKNICIWQHAISVGVSCELHSQEIFWGKIPVRFNFLDSFRVCFNGFFAGYARNEFVQSWLHLYVCLSACHHVSTGEPLDGLRRNLVWTLYR
jgi:hypothetical protein